jgi:hypothetical protein
MRWADPSPLGAVSILIYAAIWKGPGNRLGMLDRVENPGASKSPVGLRRGKGDTQNLRCFLIRHTREISQLDYLGLNRMFLGEIVKHFMHGQ